MIYVKGTVKEVCDSHSAIAHCSEWNLTLKYIDHFGNQAYLERGIDSVHKTYHRLKIYYTPEDAYVVLGGHRIYLSEFLRTGVHAV